MASSNSMKLTYFNARGVVEVTRIMLAIADIKYEDFRFPIDTTNYSRPEFDAAKTAGALSMNMDRLPLLDVDGAQIGQSKTIERFIAKRIGFMGSSDIEAAQIDSVCEHSVDVKKAYGDARSGKKDEELTAAKAEFLNMKLKDFANKIEKCLELINSSSDGFAIGSKMSLADVRLFDLWEDFFDDKEACSEAIASCPRILASVNVVRTAAANWLETRPKTAF